MSKRKEDVARVSAEENATVVAGGEKSEDDQLSTALGIEDNGVNEGSSARSPSRRLI